MCSPQCKVPRSTDRPGAAGQEDPDAEGQQQHHAEAQAGPVAAAVLEEPHVGDGPVVALGQSQRHRRTASLHVFNVAGRRGANVVKELRNASWRK